MRPLAVRMRERLYEGVAKPMLEEPGIWEDYSKRPLTLQRMWLRRRPAGYDIRVSAWQRQLRTGLPPVAGPGHGLLEAIVAMHCAHAKLDIWGASMVTGTRIVVMVTWHYEVGP